MLCTKLIFGHIEVNNCHFSRRIDKLTKLPRKLIQSSEALQVKPLIFDGNLLSKLKSRHFIPNSHITVEPRLFLQHCRLRKGGGFLRTEKIS